MQLITFFAVRDLARTADFYERLLGLPLARDQGDCRIYRVNENAFVGFCARAHAPENPPGVILTLVTEAVDAWHARLFAQGVAFDMPPTRNERYRIDHCFLRDPDGYRIEIQRFEEPLK